jgi:hypothetical protein
MPIEANSAYYKIIKVKKGRIVGLAAISLEFHYLELSFKRTRQLDILMSVMLFKTTLLFHLIVLNYFPVMQDK